MFEAEDGEIQRATALLSYYKGYQVFGCDHHVVEKHNLTVFVNEGDDEFPVYKCLQVTYLANLFLFFMYGSQLMHGSYHLRGQRGLYEISLEIS